MKSRAFFLLFWAAALAAQGLNPLPVDGDYVQDNTCQDGTQCISVAACFTADFAGDAKLSRNGPFVVTLPSHTVAPTSVVLGHPCCRTFFRLVQKGTTPASGALLLRVRTQRNYVQDAVLLLRYVSSAHTVFLEPNPEG